jgi:hypothetical protein
MENVKQMNGMVLAGSLVLLLAIASLGIVATPASAALDAVWVNDVPMGDVRAQAVIVSDGAGLVYVIGGVVDTFSYDPVGDANTYNLETGEWSTLTPMPYPVRGAAGATGLDGNIYVFGGSTASANTDVVQVYHPDTDEWTYAVNMPAGVWQGRAATGYNGYIYVAGGYTSVFTVTDAVQIYDPVLDTWYSGAVMPVALNGGAFVSSPGGDALIYLGGSATSWTDATDYFFVYYVSGDSWDSYPSMPAALAGHAAAFGMDWNLYVFGGGPDGFNLGDSYASSYWFSFETYEWSAGPDMNVAKRHLGGAATLDGKVYAFGGNNNTDVFDGVEMLEVARATTVLTGSPVAQGGYLTMTVSVDFAFSVPDSYYAGFYMLSESGIVYGTWSVYVPMDAPAVLQLDIPEVAPAGTYTIVMDYLEVYQGWIYVDFPSESWTVTVYDSYTIEEQLAMLEANVTALGADLQSQLDALAVAVADGDAALAANISALQTAVDALSADLVIAQESLDDLATAVDEGDAALADDIAALQTQLTALQTSLTSLQTSIDEANQGVTDVQGSVDDKMSLVMGYAIIGLLVVVILLLAMMMVMGRKAAPPPPSS